jgi:hypothetical protein
VTYAPLPKISPELSGIVRRPTGYVAGATRGAMSFLEEGKPGQDFQDLHVMGNGKEI